jgi:D-arabinose 1-dehydrogenase-like Zn-dependent alcohol dehydrogenase
MRAVVFKAFGSVPEVQDVPEPEAPPGGVVVRVEATGICRSDWHALAGHDPDVVLPHVPGHEFAGTVHRLGDGVANGGEGFAVGDRVTAPFVYACGVCPPCRAGEQQVCLDQRQPGFTRWGSFAQYVVVERAAVNLIRLPAEVDFATAAVLGCRFATSFRAVTAVGALRSGEWVAVHGCGGVGLSAIMIAVAAGARVVAVDISPGALELASRLGAEVLIDATDAPDGVPLAVRNATGGGAQLSLDALGSHATCAASIACLRPRGRHVQVGLLPPVNGLPPIPMHLVVAGELQILGSHGMAAHAYPQLLSLVASGRLRPDLLITGMLDLDQAGPALAAMGDLPPTGVQVVYPHGTSP